MRVALLLRGVTYVERFVHRYGIPPFTVDFRDTAPSIRANLIQPFVDAGHTVDVFLTTYHSALEDEVIRTYAPKKIHFHGDYAPISPQDHEPVAEPLMITQSLEMIAMSEEYEAETGTRYDFLILTRPDLYYYRRITDVHVDFTMMNLSFWHIAKPANAPPVFSGDDNFIGLPRSASDTFKECLAAQKSNGHSLHLTGKYMMARGLPVRYLFGEKGDGAYDYPLFKFGRHLFGQVREFGSVDDNLRVPLNRVFHSEEERRNPGPITRTDAAIW